MKAENFSLSVVPWRECMQSLSGRNISIVDVLVREDVKYSNGKFNEKE